MMEQLDVILVTMMRTEDMIVAGVLYIVLMTWLVLA